MAHDDVTHRSRRGTPRHRARSGTSRSRARHRAPGRVRRTVDRARAAIVVDLAAMVLMLSMLSHDPAFANRS